MSDEDVAQAALGARPDALEQDVSLATPLTLNRVTGRDRVASIMQRLASVLSLAAPEFVAENDERAVVTFAGTVEGRDVGLLAVLTPGPTGRYGAVDLYARPWPFIAIAREKLAAEDALFRDDVDLSAPYVPSGPTPGYLDTPAAGPGLAEDVAFHSPVLTATASGRDLVRIVLKYVGETYGEPHYRVVAPSGNSIVSIYDGTVHGHVFQVAAVLTLNQAGEIADMRIYSRPWPVTALFRGEVYKPLRDTLGPEFWQGPNPLDALRQP